MYSLWRLFIILNKCNVQAMINWGGNEVCANAKSMWQSVTEKSPFNTPIAANCMWLIFPLLCLTLVRWWMFCWQCFSYFTSTVQCKKCVLISCKLQHVFFNKWLQICRHRFLGPYNEDKSYDKAHDHVVCLSIDSIEYFSNVSMECVRERTIELNYWYSNTHNLTKGEQNDKRRWSNAVNILQSVCRKDSFPWLFVTLILCSHTLHSQLT